MAAGRGGSGCSADFTDFFKSVYPAAYRVGYRLLGEPSAAEDAAAEAFSRAYAEWDRVGELPYRDAWVLRVTANVALSSLRRRTPALSSRRAVAFDDATATRLALVAALRRLPVRQREVIVLHHLAGLDNAEVAAALGIGHNTAKTHLRRGLGALRVAVGDLGSGEGSTDLQPA